MNGILYIVIASLLFGLSPSLEKLLLIHGIPDESIILFSCMVTFLICTVTLMHQKKSPRINPEKALLLMLVGALGHAATGLFLLWSYSLISVSLSTFLHFSYPAIVVLASVIIFHENLTRNKVGGILLAGVGMLLISGEIHFNGSVITVIPALLSAVSYAVYLIAGESDHFREIPLDIRMFYYLLGSVFLAIPLSLYRHTAIPVSAPSGILIFLLSLISYVAYKSINCGISAMGAANAAFLNLLEPVFGVLFSVMILKERLSFASFIGCTLTALSSLFLNFS